MRARLSRLAAFDEGMTLVEVMVAMMVLTVVFSAMASVLITSLHSLVGNENRVRANALANEVLEDLQERRWRYVGFTEDDFDDEGVVKPDRTVIVDDQLGDYVEWKNDEARAKPVKTASRDNTTYTIETHIIWESDDATATDEDYKNFLVEVRWDEFARQRSTTHSAQRTPSSSEADSGLTIRSVTVKPSWEVLEAEDPDDPNAPREVAQAVEVIVRVNGTYDSLELQITHPDGSTETKTLHNVGPSEYSTQLFDLATYHGETTFTVTGERDGAVATKSAVAHYVHAEVAIGEPDLEEGACVREDDDGSLVLDDDAHLAFHVDGTIREDLVDVSPEKADAVFEATYTGLTKRGANWEVTLPGGTRVPPGDGEERPRFTIAAERAYDGDHAQAGNTDSLTLPVDRCEEEA